MLERMTSALETDFSAEKFDTKYDEIVTGEVKEGVWVAAQIAAREIIRPVMLNRDEELEGSVGETTPVIENLLRERNLKILEDYQAEKGVPNKQETANLTSIGRSWFETVATSNGFMREDIRGHNTAEMKRDFPQRMDEILKAIIARNILRLWVSSRGSAGELGSAIELWSKDQSQPLQVGVDRFQEDLQALRGKIEGRKSVRGDAKDDAEYLDRDLAERGIVWDEEQARYVAQ